MISFVEPLERHLTRRSAFEPVFYAVCISATVVAACSEDGRPTDVGGPGAEDDAPVIDNGSLEGSSDLSESRDEGDTESGEPSCGLLGVPCPDGFECTPLEHTFLDNGITEFCYSAEEDAVFVPAGDFWMGNVVAKGEGYWESDPQHLVTTSSYVLMRNLATIGDYILCKQWPKSACGPLKLGSFDEVKTLPEYLDLPVFSTFRSDADDFCAWKAVATGKEWRVCSEAEWEKAARGGCETLELEMAREGTTCAEAVRIFPWGDLLPVCDLGISSFCNWPALELYRPHAVGSRPAGAGPYGALDMWGNVEQWVADCDHYGDYEGAPTDGSAWVTDCSFGHDCLPPALTDTVPEGVARGSGWGCVDCHAATLEAVTTRRATYPEIWDGCGGSDYGEPRSHYVGIRCCRDF